MTVELHKVGDVPEEYLARAREEVSNSPLFGVYHGRLILLSSFEQECPETAALAKWVYRHFAKGRFHSIHATAIAPGWGWVRPHRDPFACFGTHRLSVALEPQEGAHFKAGGDADDHDKVGKVVEMMPGEVWEWDPMQYHSVPMVSGETSRIVLMVTYILDEIPDYPAGTDLRTMAKRFRGYKNTGEWEPAVFPGLD